MGFEMKCSGNMGVILDYLKGWSCVIILDVGSNESPFKQLLQAVHDGFDACGVLATWLSDTRLGEFGN